MLSQSQTHPKNSLWMETTKQQTTKSQKPAQKKKREPSTESEIPRNKTTKRAIEHHCPPFSFLERDGMSHKPRARSARDRCSLAAQALCFSFRSPPYMWCSQGSCLRSLEPQLVESDHNVPSKMGLGTPQHGGCSTPLKTNKHGVPPKEGPS